MTEADTEAIKRRVEAWRGMAWGHYDVSGQLADIDYLLTALDAAERENSRLRERAEGLRDALSEIAVGDYDVMPVNLAMMMRGTARSRLELDDEDETAALTTPPAPEDAP